MEFGQDDVLACRNCGNTYRWSQRPVESPQICTICAYGSLPREVADRGPSTVFVPATPMWTAKMMGASARGEWQRAKRERAARRGGWRPPSGGMRGEPMLAADAYRGRPPSGWLRVTA